MNKDALIAAGVVGAVWIQRVVCINHDCFNMSLLDIEKHRNKTKARILIDSFTDDL